MGFANDVFELGEDLFDRVEIGAVGRQEEELGTGCADGSSHGLPFVDAWIVEHDNIAGTKRGDKNLLDVGCELWTLMGPSKTQGALIRSCRSAPMNVRVLRADGCFGDKSLAATGPAAVDFH